MSSHASADAASGFRWIFGYGSLVWRPAFAHSERRPAWIRGFARRFWQGSTDHRGVPGAPGRVVTLTPERETRCFGMAYRVEPDVRDEVLAALDHREKNGYERRIEPLFLAPSEGSDAGGEARGLVYIATPDNPDFLGPAPMEEIAAQVRTARGPSGANLEYALELARALRAMGAHDSHVFELAALLEAETPRAAEGEV